MRERSERLLWEISCDLRDVKPKNVICFGELVNALVRVVRKSLKDILPGYGTWTNPYYRCCKASLQKSLRLYVTGSWHVALVCHSIGVKQGFLLVNRYENKNKWLEGPCWWYQQCSLQHQKTSYKYYLPSKTWLKIIVLAWIQIRQRF